MTSQAEISDVARETVYILEYFNPEFIAKIPTNFLNTLKELSQKSNIPVSIDRNKKLKEQEVLGETKDLISLIYYSYIATEEQKKELTELWSKNELLYQEELREKYNPDNIFKKKPKKEENVQMIVYKKNIFQRILDKIKKR